MQHPVESSSTKTISGAVCTPKPHMVSEGERTNTRTQPRMERSTSSGATGCAKCTVSAVPECTTTRCTARRFVSGSAAAAASAQWRLAPAREGRRPPELGGRFPWPFLGGTTRTTKQSGSGPPEWRPPDNNYEPENEHQGQCWWRMLVLWHLLRGVHEHPKKCS